MQKDQIKQALTDLRNNSTKRNFNQSIDLIITLRDLDLKKPENQIDLFTQLTHPKTKKIKTCAIIGPELMETAKENCDTILTVDDFPEYRDNKRKLIKLAKEHDFFIAQATIMPQIAKAFGRILGTRGKMPNPKAGCVVPPKANLKPLVEKLQKTVRVTAKTQLCIKTTPGDEKMEDDKITENIMNVYNAAIHSMPQEERNVKDILVKFTMSKPITIGKKKQTKENE
ncbi:50S ribosomal protein L1 [Candidatus Woesearchaeota archaeon]|nr:50S ribosomal protein L1 [Candidatus Woesearchaeota archaeon]